MAKKIVWLVVSCLMVAALLLASCAAAEEEEEVVITEEEEEVVVVEEEEVVAPTPETPKYGGVINLPVLTDILGFDEGSTGHYQVYTLWLTNEELLTGDWVKGPAGTHEADLILGGVNRMELKTGSLAESWEIPEQGTMIFHIRQGVHYALDPASEASRLVNGRELTADDVVFSLKRYCELNTSYIRMSYPDLGKSAEITAPDKWTVVVKVPLEEWTNMVTLFPDFASIVPPEVVEKYGDMNDWRNSVGTGPFMLKDFVAMSSASLIRNPNYWDTDPVGPGKGNQLPYIDGVNYLIIPDVSTRIAALRTGKIDRLSAVTWEEAADIIETNPELLYRTNISDSCLFIAMRLDKPELPFADIRVRQALHLALNHQEIVDEFYGGEAEILVWPLIETKEYQDAYVPLDELPESVQELYQYHPEKAKQLLVEAGYPDGFKTSVICHNAAANVDYLSLVKAYWAEIGVDLEIDGREYGVLSGMASRRRYDEMMYYASSGIGTYMKMINFRGPGRFNQGYIDDAHVETVYEEMLRYDIATEEAEIARLNRELMPYLLEQAYLIAKPNPYLYTFWQPWVENYRGEGAVGYYNAVGWVKYLWLNQDLKEEMTGRR